MTKTQVKTLVELVRDIPPETVFVPRQRQNDMMQQLVALNELDLKLHEARRGLKLAIAACVATMGNVPPDIADSLEAALNLIPEGIVERE